MTPSISPRNNTEYSYRSSGITLAQLYELVKGLTRKEWSYTALITVFLLWPLAAGSYWFWSSVSTITIGGNSFVSYSESLAIAARFLAVAPMVVVAAMWLCEKGLMLPLMTVLSFSMAALVFWEMKDRVFDGSAAYMDACFIGACMVLACLTFVYKLVRYGRYGYQPKG